MRVCLQKGSVVWQSPPPLIAKTPPPKTPRPNTVPGKGGECSWGDGSCLRGRGFIQGNCRCAAVLVFHLRLNIPSPRVSDEQGIYL